MTTSPVDGEPPADMKDPTSDSVGGSPAATDDADGADAMGIDEDDPIDATLVGGPVDGGTDADGATTQRPAAPPPDAGGDREAEPA